MKKKIILSVLFAVVFTVSLHVSSVFAAPSYLPPIITSQGTSGLVDPTNLGQFLANVIFLLIGVAGFLVLIYLVVAGIKYVMSSGEAEKTGEARKQIIAALIGMAIVLLSYFLVTLVFNILGITGGATTIQIPCVDSSGNPGYLYTSGGTTSCNTSSTPAGTNLSGSKATAQ